MGRSGKDAERYNTSNVFVMEARAGAAPREITKYDGLHGSASRGRPEWSPDGTKLAYLQSSGAKLGAYNMSRLAVVAVAGGEPKILADTLDRGVSAPRFTTDGASILFLVGDDASEYPARIPANGGEVQRLIRGPVVISSMDQGKDGRLAVLAANDGKSGRGSRVREQRTARADAPQRRPDGGVQTGRHGRVQLQGERRQRGPRADCEAGGLCGREEVSDAAADSWRTERTGRALVQFRAAAVRRQRLRRGGGELSRQFGARRKIPDCDLGGLGQ